MAYSYQGSTKQLGVAHPNIMVALKIDPSSSDPVTMLATTQADASGLFKLTWTGWDGRVAIGHIDNDGVVELQCAFADYQEASLVTGRYTSMERLLPDFLYTLDEESGPYVNAIKPGIDLEVKSGWTAPSGGDHRKLLTKFIAMPGIQWNSDLSMQEVIAGSGDGYKWAGDCALFAVIKTASDVTTSQHFGQFRTQGETEADNVMWMFYMSSGTLGLFWEHGAGVNESAKCVTTTLSASTEYCIAFSRDSVAKEVTFWVNGVKEVISYTTNATGGGDGKFMLGGQDHTSSSSGFLGIMCVIGGMDRTITDVEAEIIYAGALTPYSNAVMSLGDIEAFWPMDEVAGTVIADLSGNGHVGTYESVAFGSVAAPPGVGGNGITLDGTTSACDLGDFVFDGHTNLMFGAWFMVQTEEDWNRFFMFINATGSNRISLSEHTTDRSFQIWHINNSLGNGHVGGLLREGLWFHLALTYNRETRLCQVWMNGVVISSFTSTYIVYGDTYEYYIGRNQAATDHMHCEVRGAFISYSAPGKSDMLALYHSGYDVALDLVVKDDLFIHYTGHNYTLTGSDYPQDLFDEMGNFDALGPLNQNMQIQPGRFAKDTWYSNGNNATNANMGDIFVGGIPTNMTITMWFKTPTSDQQGCLIGMWEATGSERAFKIWWEDSPKTLRFQVSSLGTDLAAERADIVIDLDDGQWHFLAARFTASTVIELSIDGGTWAQAATPGVMYDADTDCFLFDGDESATEDWKGYLQDVRIHKVYLSNDRIAQIQASYQEH